jgi:hypothetical protein
MAPSLPAALPIASDALYNVAPSLLSEYESTHAQELYALNGDLKKAMRGSMVEARRSPASPLTPVRKLG